MKKRDFFFGLIVGALSISLFKDGLGTTGYSLEPSKVFREKAAVCEVAKEMHNEKRLAASMELSIPADRERSTTNDRNRTFEKVGALGVQTEKKDALDVSNFLKETYELCDYIGSTYQNPFSKKNIKFCEIYVPSEGAIADKDRLDFIKKFFSEQEIKELGERKFGGISLNQHVYAPTGTGDSTVLTVLLSNGAGAEKPVIIKNISQLISSFGEIDTEEKAKFFANQFLRIYEVNHEEKWENGVMVTAAITTKAPYLAGEEWIFENYFNGWGIYSTGRCYEEYYTFALSKVGKARILQRTYLNTNAEKPENCKSD
jgi:hypothetical protein